DEGLGCVAEYIAGELVEDNDFCQATFGGDTPIEQFTARGLGVYGGKSLLNVRVQLFVFCPPLLWCEFVKPKVENVVVHGYFLLKCRAGVYEYRRDLRPRISHGSDIALYPV